ncbi:MAG: hypothetical protein U1F68_07265 [Gammaproteobacteria bacterium]
MAITEPAPEILWIWNIDRSKNTAALALPKSKIGKIEVPVRAFLGTIGTAPAGKECISSLVPGAHGARTWTSTKSWAA